MQQTPVTLLLTATVICTILPFSSCLLINFTECSDANRGAVQWVDVEPCEQEPCIFIAHEHVKVRVGVKTPIEMRNPTLMAYLVGMNIPFPGWELKICDQINCPAVPGTEFEVFEQVKVPYVPATIESDVNFIATEEDGTELVCVKVHVGISDGRQHFLKIDAVKALQTYESMKHFANNPMFLQTAFMKAAKHRSSSQEQEQVQVQEQESIQ